MQDAARLVRGLAPTVADASHGTKEWAKSPVSGLSDQGLVAAVAAAIAAPKREADTSFLTHAPLELAARAELLAMVEPPARDLARRRIAAIAAEYARAGDEIETPAKEFRDESAALDALVAALKEGDADEVDAALLYLAPRVSVFKLRAALVDVVSPMLGAAAHAPIILAELPRIEARIDGAASLLRAPLRQIAIMSSARLGWHGRARAEAFGGDKEQELMERLAAPPPVCSPSVYVAPTMLAIEANGYAEGLLADVTADLSVPAAARSILRTGALAMLQDDPAHAPYGWSHALTMPQGVLSCADAARDQRALVRVAATQALGFRATLGAVRLRDEPPPRPRRAAYFNVDPIGAAGAVYHAEAREIAGIKTALATRAATHRDAHLAKYTLAAFDAAARDPAAARLFLAAAAYLGAWWDAHPGVAFE
jgi:hypothetical protein